MNWFPMVMPWQLQKCCNFIFSFHRIVSQRFWETLGCFIYLFIFFRFKHVWDEPLCSLDVVWFSNSPTEAVFSKSYCWIMNNRFDWDRWGLQCYSRSCFFGDLQDELECYWIHIETCQWLHFSVPKLVYFRVWWVFLRSLAYFMFYQFMIPLLYRSGTNQTWVWITKWI